MNGTWEEMVLIPLRVTRLFVRTRGLELRPRDRVLIPLRVTRLFVPAVAPPVRLRRTRLNPSQGHPPLRTHVTFDYIEGSTPCLNPSQGHPPLRTKAITTRWAVKSMS